MELLTWRATAPGVAAFQNATMNTGNSATIRKFPDGFGANIIALWGKHQTTGEIRLLSPNLNEATQGIRVNDIAALVENLLPFGAINPVQSNDQITFQLTGSATGGDIEFGACLIDYDNLPGIQGNFIDADELRAMGGQVAVVENTLALGTSGDYTGQEAINAEMEILNRTDRYALLGCSVSALALCIRYLGIDTGNLGVGVPAYAAWRNQGINWFVYLSEAVRAATGKPGKTIPVLDATNQDNFLIDGVQDENGTDVLVKTYFQRLNR